MMNFSQIGTRPSSTVSTWMSALASASPMAAHAIRQPRRITEHLAHDDAAMGAGLFDHAWLDDARSRRRSFRR